MLSLPTTLPFFSLHDASGFSYLTTALIADSVSSTFSGHSLTASEYFRHRRPLADAPAHCVSKDAASSQRCQFSVNRLVINGLTLFENNLERLRKHQQSSVVERALSLRS